MIKLKYLMPTLPILVFLLIAGCHTERKNIAQPIREQGPSYLFEQLKKNEFHFKRLSVKFSVESEVDGQNASFSGHLQIQRDSLIWLSIQKFGLEAARLLITVDTCKMINRLNNTYFIGGFDYVNTLFKTDFDFDMLQALITGNDFSYYETDIFKAGIDNKNYKLSTLGRRKLKKYVRHETEYAKVLIQDIWLSPQTFKIEKILLKEVKNENRKFETSYLNFTDVEGQLFPGTIQFEITEEKKIRGTISFNKVMPEKQESLPFRIPANYTRIQ